MRTDEMISTIAAELPEVWSSQSVALQQKLALTQKVFDAYPQ
jgi:hypothetical protein